VPEHAPVPGSRESRCDLGLRRASRAAMPSVRFREFRSSSCVPPTRTIGSPWCS